MGNNKLNRLIKCEGHWSDKGAKRHKHNYSRECYLEVITMQAGKPKWRNYYHIMMCKECKSFNTIPKEGTSLGLVSEVPANADVIRCHTNCKMLGFSKLEFD